ncbi:MAG TPA: hypothetical protein VG055_18835 [Planctomycetaceae bacterium]|jgi:hypothetical protein|nr:hypothetical protein [Planctomycetaceae bacterium]
MSTSFSSASLFPETGESHGTIREFGFILARQEPEPESEPTLAVDCPGCGARLELNPSQPPNGSVECWRCDAIYAYSDEEIYVSDTAESPLAACA